MQTQSRQLHRVMFPDMLFIQLSYQFFILLCSPYTHVLLINISEIHLQVFFNFKIGI